MAATPPPFQAPAPPQAPATSSANKACLIAVVMVLLLCVVACAVGAFFFKNVFNQGTATLRCAVMFKTAHDATLAYAKEHGGKFPKAETWQDDIKPYYERLVAKIDKELDSKQLRQMMGPPAAGEPLECESDGVKTGIAYNSEIADKPVASFKEPTKTVMFFETQTTGQNVHMKYFEQPKAKRPKFMDEQRDWIIFYIEGSKDPMETSSSSSSSFEFSPDDALTPGKGTDKGSSGSTDKGGEGADQ
ncbi:MAG: hypothetical protein JST30_10435 [Armatimonadetes bacterium]|nr:hypothetical protein [Armatimonadota bacterium]